MKWEEFRAIVSRRGLEIRSRRDWNMTELLPELVGLPAGLVLEGELVSFGDDGRPSFPLLCGEAQELFPSSEGFSLPSSPVRGIRRRWICRFMSRALGLGAS